MLEWTHWKQSYHRQGVHRLVRDGWTETITKLESGKYRSSVHWRKARSDCLSRGNWEGSRETTWILNCIFKDTGELTVLLEMKGSGEGDGHLVWSHTAILIKWPALHTQQPASCLEIVLWSIKKSPWNVFIFFHEDVANQASLIKQRLVRFSTSINWRLPVIPSEVARITTLGDENLAKSKQLKYRQGSFPVLKWGN